MKKLFTYIPVVCFLFVVIFVNNLLLKITLLTAISCLIGFAKYKRYKLASEEYEYDDRVNFNILKWSLKSMVVLNALLILFILIDQSNYFQINMSIEMLLIYLLVTICIPFYIVPAIVKYY